MEDMINGGNGAGKKEPQNPTWKITPNRVWGWYHEGRDLSSKFRREAQIDADYYDNEQWTEEEKRELKGRGQPATVFNCIKPTIDLILGTEVNARIEFKAVPRRGDYVADAVLATECLKYVMDQNDAKHVFSDAFKNQVKAGWKWVEISKNDNPFEEIVKIEGVPRNDLIWDPLAKRFDRGDGKYVLRPKWLELEDGVAKFPGKKEILERAVSNEEVEPFNQSPYPGTEDQPDRPGVRFWQDSPISSTEWVDKSRKRVKLIECWYKVPVETWLVENEDTGEVEELNPSKIRMVLATPGAKLTKKMIRKVFLCIVAGNEMLWEGPSPYEHNEYPFVPFWDYIKDRDNSPYGHIRQRRDPQDEVNKRHSKAMHLLNSRQIIATSDAIDEKQNDWKQVSEQVNDPEAVILLDRQKMKDGGQFQIVSPQAQIEGQYKFEEDARRQIEEAGVNREAQGLPSNATSGRAIIARQIQSNTMTADPFENYRRSCEKVYQMAWVLIQQYWTKPKIIRITNKLGQHDFLKLNQYVEYNGRIFVRNAISRMKVDIVIEEQAFNATVREALANQMFEITAKLPPEIGLLWLDEVVDLLDVPNKDRLMQKIQMAQGMMKDRAQQEQENQRMIAEATKQKAASNETNTRVDRRSEESAMSQGLV